MAGVASALAVLWPAPAAAAWTKAETDRFIVYGQGREAQVRDVALRLSMFDATLRIANPAAAQAPPRKLEVYLVRGIREIQQIAPEAPPDVAGLYSAGESAAFVLADADALGRDDVLFHEYAHAFMLENFPAAYPGWFIEGWAEYFMTAEVTPRSVTIGSYNPARLYALFALDWLPWETVVTKAAYEIPIEDRSVYYSQAWLLMHYMRSHPERATQLTNATQAIAAGENPVKALEAASGKPLGELTRGVRLYKKLALFVIKDPLPNPPEIKVTQLPPSADDLLLYKLRLERGGPSPQDAQILAEVRARAAKWPGDRIADLILARAEFALGDVAAGEAIVKRRLEQDPKDVETLLVAGLGQLQAGDRDPSQLVDRYQAARPLLIRAYDLGQDDYRTLLNYVRSRSVEPEFPNDNDINALLTARALAPTVKTSSLMAGELLLSRGRRPEALAVLSIVANDPHGGEIAKRAQALIDGAAASGPSVPTQ
jgi:hypothetical protein